MRINFLVVMLLIMVLGLPACRPAFDVLENPTFMPAGYTYHNNTYKAPPGPPAPDIGYSYNALRNQEILEGWDNAAADLVEQLGEKGVFAQIVYVETLPQNDAFTGSYDNALREALKEQGYVLENNSQAPVRIRYDAYLPVDENMGLDRTRNQHTAYVEDEVDDFILVLTALQNGSQVAQVSGVYRLPAYGYHKDTEDAPVADLVLGTGR